LGISFGKTLDYLLHKTVTRRCWKDSHAQKFINAFHQNKLIKALDKDIRYGGKQIGWCRLLCAPYKERLAAMPEPDLEAEGGMCSSVTEFIQQYFKGNSSLEVWVIRFELVSLDRVASTNTPELLGVYSESALESDSNPILTSLINGIHQGQLSEFSLCENSASTTDSNSPITSATDSIHQASLIPLGVYSAIQNKANSRFSITSAENSIHQASPAPLTSFSLCSNNSHQSNSNDSVSTTDITTDSADSVSASLEHQTLPGVYPSNGHQSDSNATNDSVAESMHQTPVIQGGSGLVYSFWKGESIVNHYRYKVKVNGNWQVKSVYIPVGKLPKVKEAIANKLSVAAIVVEVLGRNL